MLKITRKPFAVAALLAIGALCAVEHPSARADDMKPMMVDDHAKMMVEQTDKMKMMAADPAQAPAVAAEMAKMMVMDQMAKKMAMDPAVKQAAMDAMKDPAMMKVHADAKAMAADPEQAKKMEAEIMADPAAMKMVMHESMRMAMPHEKMGGGMTGDAKQMAGDKMDDMKK